MFCCWLAYCGALNISCCGREVSWFPWRSITWRPHLSGMKEGRDERRLSDAINTSNSGIVKILIYRSIYNSEGV